jgi:hypothetical protein
MNKNFIFFHKNNGDWGLGIGDWGLGIGPNPQSPIPQSPFTCLLIDNKKIIISKNYNLIN